MEQGSFFFRIKMEWIREAHDGTLQKAKTEELAYVTTYTEAEKIAYALINDEDRTKYGSVNYEIMKTKIFEMLYNETLEHDDVLVGGLVLNYFTEPESSGVGLYSVKVVSTAIDERSNKEKKETYTIFTPANSNTDAARRVSDHLSKTMTEFIIRDIKFDKAEAILWSPAIQERKEAENM